MGPSYYPIPSEQHMAILNVIFHSVAVNLSVHLPTFGVAARQEYSLQVFTILMQPSWFCVLDIMSIDNSIFLGWYKTTFSGERKRTQIEYWPVGNLKLGGPALVLCFIFVFFHKCMIFYFCLFIFLWFLFIFAAERKRTYWVSTIWKSEARWASPGANAVINPTIQLSTLSLDNHHSLAKTFHVFSPSFPRVEHNSLSCESLHSVHRVL